MEGRTYRILFAGLLTALPLALLVASGMGAYPIPPLKIPRILWEGLMGGDVEEFRVLVHVRLPRIVLAAAAGGVLATCGAGLQGIFRNPLADPGLIGVSSGAALAAATWIVLTDTRSTLFYFGLPASAFAGGLATAWLVWRIARASESRGSGTLLLAGVALNALAGAGIGLMVYMSNEEELRGISFWQLGSLAGANWTVTLAVLPPMIVGLGLLLLQGGRLNAYALGDSEAFCLGVPSRPLLRAVVFATALAVGAAVAAVGGVGFIGLIAPHVLRLVGGADHRMLLPCAGLAGAILLVAADTVARTTVQPAEMPVGIVTALVGAPFFLWLLLRMREGAIHA